MSEKKAKRVALTMRVEDHRYPQSSEWRDAISHDWIVFLEQLNIIPLLVPNCGEGAPRYLEGVYGLILTGGGDLSYGEGSSGRYDQRDKTENALLTHAIQSHLPVLGVCRGMQAINHYFAGTLTAASSEHLVKEHRVHISECGAQLFGDARVLQVNSFHQNKIEALGKELLVMAHAEDRSIEALRHRDLPIAAVMWHPERDCSDAETQRLQRHLVQGFLSLR